MRGLRWPVLTVLVLGGAAARLAVLDVPMRYDEAGTFMNLAVHRVAFITHFYAVPGNHILHTLLVHFSWRAFGNHIWAIRLPALIPGVGLIPAAYLAARELYDERAGLWAAALVAGSGPLIEYSTNSRGYMLGVLLVVLSLWTGARAVDGAGAWSWAATGLLWTSAGYAVPTMAFGVLAVAAWMAATAIARRDPRTLLLLVLTGAAAGLLALALYSAVLGQTGWTSVQTAGRDLGRLRILATRVGEDWARTAVHPIDWVVAAAFLAALPLHRRIARHTLPIGVAATAALVVVVAADQVAPFGRTFLYLLPLCLIQAAGALSWASARAGAAPRRVGVATAVAAVAVAAILVAGELRVSQNGSETPPAAANDIVPVLRSHLRPREAVILPDPAVSLPVLYYFRRDNVVPPVLPPSPRPYRALVVVPASAGRGWFDAPPTRLSVEGAVGSVGWHVRPGARPRLVSRMEYVNVYEAAID